MAIAPHIQTVIEELIDSLCAQTTGGRARRKLVEMFLDLPDKEAWPDYYRAIPEPRSINGIKERLQNKKYKQAEDVYDDLILVMLNAEFYNEEGSQIWKDAETLKSWIGQNWKGNPVLPAPRTIPNHSTPQKKKMGGKTTLTIPPVGNSTPSIPPIKLIPPKANAAKQPSTPAARPSTPAARPNTPAMATASTPAAPAKQNNFTPLTKVSPQQPHSYTYPSTTSTGAGSSSSAMQTQFQKQVTVQPSGKHTFTLNGPGLGKKDQDNTPDPSDVGGRDAQGDEFVQQLERGLPRWSGHEQNGWTSELPSSQTPASVIDYIKDSKGPTLRHKSPSDSLADVPAEPIRDASCLSSLSFRMIDTRAHQDYYSTIEAFDLDMTRLFEKARRYFEPATQQYGHVLTCQRMYQQLMTSNPPPAPATFSPTYFSSVPAGPGTAKPLHSADSTSEDGVTTFRVSSKDRTFTDDVRYKGVTYTVADWVHLANPDDPSKPIVAQIFKTWISDEPSKKGQVGVTACWYFRPEQTIHSETRKFWEGEVFKTGHLADHAVEDIIEKIAVQFTARHIRGRPRPPYWHPGWPIYVCDSRYNDREQVFVKIKNWNSCVPDEVRKKPDWMPIYPFERIVTPRSLSSPFSRGITGPGAFEEVLLEEKNSDPSRRKTRRAAEKSAAANSEIARADRADSLGPSTQSYYTSNAASGSGAGTGTSRTGATTTAGTSTNKTDDRSIVTAAGGMAYIASMEKLPPETTKFFDRDPTTNEVLWFSGPPIDIHRPRGPQHSLEYLHFLAKKRKRQREGQEKADRPADTASSTSTQSVENGTKPGAGAADITVVDDVAVDAVTDADSDAPPPAKVARRPLTQMINEMWDEIMVDNS